MHKEKIADRVSFEASDVVMPAGRGRIDVAEALVVVGLVIVVEIMQANDLISAEDVEGICLRGILWPSRSATRRGVAEQLPHINCSIAAIL